MLEETPLLYTLWAKRVRNRTYLDAETDRRLTLIVLALTAEAVICPSASWVVRTMDAIPSNGDGRRMSLARVLVVEDHEPFRRVICSMLEKRTELQVIGKASDGLEAVCKAEELQPDLILLDIGLPKLNGIEAARRIRNLSPESRILIVSQESSADVVQEAISLGALGYVVKSHAGRELIAAVEAVREGRLFVSAGVAGHD